MDKNGDLYAFQLSGEDDNGNGGTWSIVWQDSEAGSISSVGVNIAAVCLMPDSSSHPPLFINVFDGIEETGKLVTWFNNTNVTVPLPPVVANLYRPDTPIATVYGSDFPDSQPYGANLTLLLFFPLPKSLASLSPNPSLHILSATPYWSGKAPIPESDSFVATDQRLNWTDTQLVDTGIVPYARGEAAIFTGTDLDADEGVVDSMPRAWTPLLMEGGDAGRVVVVYQDSNLAIQIQDVVGGSGRYQVITSAG
ncbi:hypothetical protein N431DRAFT_471620 [Stipitochalara longipes BDJ]|nr:hypothetical protein N431DRAFT_471620 [Stipitochalara longipes BDJ]